MYVCMYVKRSGSVVECLTRDRRAAGSSLTGVTALCPKARPIYPCLVLVQPRKIRPSDRTKKTVDRNVKNQIKQTKGMYVLCTCLRTYAFVRRQSAVHLSVCRYECSHAFGMRAGISASVCLFACTCVRASVRMCIGMSVCLC